MKITKKQLRSIIKEELKEVAGSGGQDKISQALKLAQTLKQNPIIMAAVKRAAENPKVLAVTQKLMQESDDESPQQRRDRGRAAAVNPMILSAVAKGLAGLGSHHAPLGELIRALVGEPAVVALGIGGSGLFMYALVMLVMAEAGWAPGLKPKLGFER